LARPSNGDPADLAIEVERRRALSRQPGGKLHIIVGDHDTT
jgi:hypothetical protein